MYIDLTQTFSNQMPVYPGDPEPQIEKIADLDKDGFIDQRVTFGMHVGTHLDAPEHLVSGGAQISDLDVSRCFGRGVLVDARNAQEIGPALVENLDIQAGDIVLVWTNWGLKFGQPDYYYNFPQVTEDFANVLVEKKVSMVGFDLPSPDKQPYPIHKILLKNDIYMIENLTNLEKLFNLSSFQVIVLPPKWQTNASPVRVVASI